MELLHVDEIRPVQDGSEKSVKQVFGAIKDFDELIEKFVFYMPVIHHLIGDAGRVKIPTDIVSHTLAHVLREHPLVITDLPRTVFRFDERLVTEMELKSFQRTLYAVPTEAWNQTVNHLKMLTVFDQATRRFCVLTPHLREIRNPIGSHEEFLLPVHYFNCYGNRETWYFTDEILEKDSTNPTRSNDPPILCYHPPIREFMQVAERALQRLENQAGTPMEEAIRRAAEEMENEAGVAQMLAIQKENKLFDKISTPLSESTIDEHYRRECHDIIRFHESVFGSSD